MGWTQVCYTYDGSFAGFLCGVFDSYAHREIPVAFAAPEEARASLWPERTVKTDRAHALRVYRSLAARISPAAQRLVERGFLTCLSERELCLWRFIHLGYQRGGAITGDLTCDEVHTLQKAVRALEHEAHLLKGFLRFSDQEGVLTAQITPKNRVLPLLHPHFCARYPREAFAIYDKTHGQLLLARPGKWAIVPAEYFQPGAPGAEELSWRALWRRFYDTIAIPGRENPKCRMTQMPKRYWENMTEFQADPPCPDGAGGEPSH